MRSDVHPPIEAVRQVVALALAEDLLPMGDLTSSLLDSSATGRAAFVARKPGIVAGTLAVAEVCRQVDASLVLELRLEEGTAVDAGAVIAELSGPFTSLLTAERTALNFLSHLSGVASLTGRYVAAARAVSPTVRIWDTRKTTPGLRALEKAAVRAGGGVNHRASLSDAVLVKDNHLGGISIEDAVARAKQRWPGRMVEVECDRLEQVERAAMAGATVVLCDNMTPDQVRDAVGIVERVGGRSRALVEASGGISLETVAAYAATGVDLISVGALTHSAPILDVGLDLLAG